MGTVIAQSAALRGFLDHLRMERGLSANTLRRYTRILTDVEGALTKAGRTLLNAEADDFTAFIRGQAHLASSSVRQIVDTIRNFLGFAKELGANRDQVRNMLDLPKQAIRLPVVLNKEQVAALVTAPDRHDAMYLRDVALLETLYACGLRVSEACGMRVRDVDFAGRSVRVLGKGNKERVVPLGGVAATAITAYLEGLRPVLEPGPCELLFLTRTGKQMFQSNVWNLIQKVAKRARITQKISPHTLRHCFATHLVGGGANLRVVQELLGHTDITTTQIYVHTDHTRLKAVHTKCHPRG